MITTALTTFLTSVFVFVVLVIFTQQERRRGRRLFASAVRVRMDAFLRQLHTQVARSISHFMRYMVQLNWYYSIHSVLRTILRVTVAIYTFFEDVFERNRKRAKELRAEKRQLSERNHLQQMAVHRVDTALTPKQQKKLKDETLEGKL